jgi:hypothetical protein
MKFWNIATILTILLFATTVFAAAPTVGLPTISNSYTSDKNYLDVVTDINAVAVGTSFDGNCYISINDTNLKGTFNTDTNTCGRNYSTITPNDDLNIMVIVSTDANGYSPIAYYWKDSNAPVSTASVSDQKTGGYLTISSTDVATNTGNGSGVATIYYNIDGGAFKTYSSRVTITGVGTRTITYYAVDNLGNDENAVYGLNTATLTVSGGGAVTCGMVSLFPILLIFVMFFGGTGIFAISQAKNGDLNALLNYGIMLIIGIVLLLATMPILCG